MDSKILNDSQYKLNNKLPLLKTVNNQLNDLFNLGSLELDEKLDSNFWLEYDSNKNKNFVFIEKNYNDLHYNF